MELGLYIWDDKISIHAPREGCDLSDSLASFVKSDFNPRTPRGVRRSFVPTFDKSGIDFNPRTPRGVRRLQTSNILGSLRDFNPRTPRGVRLEAEQTFMSLPLISIHAPREGCDWSRHTRPPWPCISIHAPREGCDDETCRHTLGRCYFNPRTPRGVRRRK